jgi:hypothetical protein
VGRFLTDVAGVILMFLRSILRDHGYRVPSYVAITRVPGGSRLKHRTGALLNGYLECITVCRVVLVVPDDVPALQQIKQMTMRLPQD